MTERAAFGAELRRARERRGLALEAIAEQTKVSATHFAGLERADLSRWPAGIFGRAFVRSYALAIGLDPEETVARFRRLYPEPADETAAATPAAVAATDARDDEPGQRLVLDPRRSSRVSAVVPAAWRLGVGIVDVTLALTPAALIALAAGVQWFWPVLACVAIAGHLACFALLGTTPGAWLMNRVAAKPSATAAPVASERRRADDDGASVSRRRVPRHQASRPSQHAHRVRH